MAFVRHKLGLTVRVSASFILFLHSELTVSLSVILLFGPFVGLTKNIYIQPTFYSTHYYYYDSWL